MKQVQGLPFNPLRIQPIKSCPHSTPQYFFHRKKNGTAWKCQGYGPPRKTNSPSQNEPLTRDSPHRSLRNDVGEPERKTRKNPAEELNSWAPSIRQVEQELIFLRIFFFLNKIPPCYTSRVLSWAFICPNAQHLEDSMHELNAKRTRKVCEASIIRVCFTTSETPGPIRC